MEQNVMVSVSRGGIGEDRKELAFASITFPDGGFTIRNIKVYDGVDRDTGELKQYIKMPQVRTFDENGRAENRDVFFGTTKEAQQALEKIVLTEYDTMIKKNRDSSRGEYNSLRNFNCMMQEVKVNPFEGINDKKAKGYAYMTFGDGVNKPDFAVRSLVLREPKDPAPGVPLVISAPAEKVPKFSMETKLYSDEYSNSFVPMNVDSSNAFRKAVTEEYNKKLAEKRGENLNETQSHQNEQTKSRINWPKGRR